MDLGRDHRLSFAASLLLADLLGVARQEVRVIDVPEITGTVGDSPIELIVDIGGRRVSLEHTLIESYEGQISDAEQLRSFVELVNSSLGKRLPEGVYRLVFHTGAVAGWKRGKGRIAAGAVASWVDDVAPEMAVQARERRQSVGLRRMADPIEIALQYLRTEGVRPLSFARWVPEDIERRRVLRLATSFRRKLDKLARTRELGYEPCLVLEDKDISSANPDLIAEAAKGALAGFSSQAPEWILLAETFDNATALWFVLYQTGSWTWPYDGELVQIDVPEQLVFP